ncbi:hypothetical protein WSM22_30570 [Cytophagales bacterium WSM2-2]|nr:hypothetical protein WSM22_30570 [Cytophagales bacterium WSM2-2]
MKNFITVLGLFLLVFCSNVSGQNFPSPNPKLYVIKADDKTLTTDGNGVSFKEEDANANLLVYINSDWVASMDVLKGKDATDKYGARGLNGVIILTLRKDGFSKMHSQDKERFKKNE